MPPRTPNPEYPMPKEIERRAQKALLSWSGGKDSAMALHEILKSKEFEIAALLTTVTMDYDRISMHGVRRTLLQRQAESLGLTLEELFITKNATNAEYETSLAKCLTRYRDAGITTVVFGDIFLEDVRLYREERLTPLGMHAIFPLWKRDTGVLAHGFIAAGFRAVTTCIDTKVLGEKFSGREFDEQFLADLPPGIDPCGENGEFHSFVYDGPIFSRPIAFTPGEKVFREERFCYCDLVPGVSRE